MHYTIDAKNKQLGRLASQVAHILQGKKSPSYERNKPGIDTVLITHIKEVVVTGGKEKKKIYYQHTGYMGHLKRRTYEMMFSKSPEEVLRRAVSAMLPKNFLRQDRMNRLKVEK